VPKFANVMVVSDLSDISNHAIPWAYALVDDGGTVHLVHVLEFDPSPSPLTRHPSKSEMNLPEARALVVGAAEQTLKTLIPPDAAARRIASRVEAVLHADVVKGIVAEAEQRQVDAIVMGSRGRSGLERLVTGSFCSKVTQASPVPVLVVPRED